MNFFKTQPLQQRQKDNNIFTASCILVLLLATIFIDPREVSILACQLKNSTGYSCLTCGLSRSFYAIAHLKLSEAISYHLLGPLLYLSFVLLFIKSTIELFINKEIKLFLNSRILKIIAAVLAIGWLSNWIVNFLQL